MSFRATGLAMLFVLFAAQLALAAHASVHFALHEPLFAAEADHSEDDHEHQHDPRPGHHQQCSICLLAAHGMAKALVAAMAAVPVSIAVPSEPAGASSQDVVTSRHECAARPRAPPIFLS